MAPAPRTTGAATQNANVDLVEVRDQAADSGTLSFDFVLDHQSTIERPVNPSGPLNLASADPSKLKSCFKELRLSDGLFSRMNVTASTAGVKFADDGIDRVHVFFQYEQRDEKHPDQPMVRHSFDGVLASETEAVTPAS